MTQMRQAPLLMHEPLHLELRLPSAERRPIVFRLARRSFIGCAMSRSWIRSVASTSNMR